MCYCLLFRGALHQQHRSYDDFPVFAVTMTTGALPSSISGLGGYPVRTMKFLKLDSFHLTPLVGFEPTIVRDKWFDVNGLDYLAHPFVWYKYHEQLHRIICMYCTYSHRLIPTAFKLQFLSNHDDKIRR